MSAFVEAASSELDSNREVTLAEAAKRLSCNIETLRRRVRTGALKANRGPHGAYLVREADLGLVWVEPGRGRPPRIQDEEATWALLQSLVFKFGRTRSDARRLLSDMRADPTTHPRLQRLLHVLRLRLMGLPYREIAAIADTTERHARRLAHRDLELVLREELRRDERRRVRERRKTAGEVIAGIERRLRDAGYRGLTRAEIVAAWPKRIGRRQRYLNRDERAHLQSIGITDLELDAIEVGGIPVDAVHFMLTRGLTDGDPLGHETHLGNGAR